jgi:hypothetical protein
MKGAGTVGGRNSARKTCRRDLKRLNKMKPEIRNLEKRVDTISERDSIQFPGTELKQLRYVESIWLRLRRELVEKKTETDVERPLTIEERQLIYKKRMNGFFDRPVEIVHSDKNEGANSWLRD